MAVAASLWMSSRKASEIERMQMHYLLFFRPLTPMVTV